MDGLDLEPTPRRGFLGRIAAGAVAIAAGGLAMKADAQPRLATDSPWDEKWITRIKGKHRQVFDAMEVNSGFPLAMTYVSMFRRTRTLQPEALRAQCRPRPAARCRHLRDERRHLGEVQDRRGEQHQ